MKMPFGKYEDTDIEDLPSSYLKWLTENCDDEEIVSEAEDELKFRTDHDVHWYGD